jgi:two-component system response regulator HydG
MANILLLEDDLNHLELLTEVIKFGNHIPYPANNIEKALKILKNQRINLIITDISLINETGLDFIAHLHKQNIKIPFIVVSGSTDMADRQKAENLKALSFLSKPVDPEMLLKLIG